MDIINNTPFTAATMLWEDLEAQPKLSVIVKATFAIQANQPADIAAEQRPVLVADVPYDGDHATTVRLETDMVPFKPRTDVVLVGRAYAPGRRPVTHLDVTLRVGRLRKTIRVFGDRRWWFPSRLMFVPVMTPRKLFLSMDLVYERAFGGIDTAAARYCKENLVGTGFIGKKSKTSIHKKPLPNLEDAAHCIRWWRSRPKPVGFGFYGRGWAPRMGYAGTYDDRYQKERAPAPPRDFSYAFYNGAHPDLQVDGYLRGDEDVELTHLSQTPVLRFRLPGIQPTITVVKWTVSPDKWIDQHTTADHVVSLDEVPTIEETVPAVLDTLVFLPDEGIFYLVFRGVCSLTHLDEPEVACIKVGL